MIVHGQLETLEYPNQWQPCRSKKCSLVIAGKYLCEEGVCMVGANVRRDVNHSETSQTNRISGSEMFLEEKGGEIEPKWENTFISSGWEYL